MRFAERGLRNTKSVTLVFVGISLLYLSSLAPVILADDTWNASGSLDLRGVEALESDSIKEEPSLIGKVKLDTGGPAWRFNAWIEGGWDGSVKRPVRDHSLFKNYDEVYQSNTTYLEFKELCVTRTSGDLDIRAGIQRFAWGRLDEYPPNDLLNPWDYTQFLRKSLEDRKIGVPSVSAKLERGGWAYEAVWVPVFVPYRLAMPDERWAGSSDILTSAQAITKADITPQEPVLPDRRIENGNIGLRMKRVGDIEWTMNLFHGFDPKPVFKTTAFTIVPQGGNVLIDPGYIPDFHRITVIGTDAAAVRGDVSLRAEAAYSVNRYFNIRRELWGYPSAPTFGTNALNPDIEQKFSVLDYGIGADCRLFEDGLLTTQAQQTIILGNVDLLYEKKVETILWANVKVNWMNQKIETNFSMAYNPEHGDRMVKANAWYVFSDLWKAGLAALDMNGPTQSMFGRYSMNDQIEVEIKCIW